MSNVQDADAKIPADLAPETLEAVQVDTEDSQSPPHATLTKKEAWNRYSRLHTRVKKMENKSPHFSMLLSPARIFLELFPISRSNDSNSSADVPEPGIALAMLAGLLPLPSRLFSAQSLMQPTSPAYLLLDLAAIYNLDSVDATYLTALNLSNVEKSHRGITNQIWLAYVIGLDPSEARIVIDRFRSVRLDLDNSTTPRHAHGVP